MGIFKGDIMIKYVIGNIFESEAEALVNTVNTVGVMGKGIALQFKKIFNENFKIYKESCKNNEIDIGKLLVVKDSSLLTGEKYIINFPTKKDWRKPSEYSYIEDGLEDLKNVIYKYKIRSIAIPPLGAGNGGLIWENVKKIIEQKLNGLDIEIIVYEPTKQIREKLFEEKVNLTESRALLLFVLYDLIRNGEYVSEFSSEKVCYFLQRFGAKKYFKLVYNPNFYGPYSGKVRYILNTLNGSYIVGYSDMNKKPFEPLFILPDAYNDVIKYINENLELQEIAENTTKFLNGFYSDFSLELLSSIDYISQKINSLDKIKIKSELDKWSERKRSLISQERYFDIAISHLKNTTFIN